MNFFKRHVQRKTLSLILISLILGGFTSFANITPVFGQPSISIELEWRKNAGTGSTWLGPLAADLNGDGLMEIVINGMNGIAALNATNGNIIWGPKPYTAGHGPCEIIDLNKDSIPEILFVPDFVNGTAGGGVLALHGNNGSVYWYNRNAAGDDTYIAVADINADGYPEIYSVRPGLITALTYNGTIFDSTYTYYSCWGGLSIGDTDFDGVFEIYLGERSSTYPPPGQPGHGLGRGLRSFWADNLTERWCHPDILCSSQAPVLADVDNDGDLEIIILNQSPSGVAVINTDGSVNTYKEIYRKSAVSGLITHSNPPVADLDGDGNLELITCGDHRKTYTPPKIWDLVDWKLDATLPFGCNQPPGVADVDGDGKLEIIAPNQQNVTIFKYNQTTTNYDIIHTIPLSMAHPFSIAQDIDADGKLELVFNQHNSWVSVYEVNVEAPTPLPRSGRYFYSEYRTRVPVYVPPPDQPPKISEISPGDGATNVPTTLNELSFKLIDFQNDLMNYTVTTHPNIGSANDTNVASGTIITVPVSGLTSSTTYTWNVIVTDGTYTTTRTFTFYTEVITPTQYQLTISVSGSGTTDPTEGSYIYDEGSVIPVTAYPASGWRLDYWLLDEVNVGDANPYAVTMYENHKLTAVFVQEQYILTTNAFPEEGGQISRNNTGPYYYGDAVQLTAEPNDGWYFSHWEEETLGKQNPITITIDGNKTITAVFTQEISQWWNTAWPYRRKITINHTKVSGELTDFPVLIEIVDDSLAEKAQSDGDDFVFTDMNNMKLDHQIEFYNSSTGHLIAWVKVPYLSSTADTILYMYYGNSGCGNQQNPTGVWDENYKLVLHLNEETGIHYDSTINGNNGTPVDSLVQGATGAIGNCVEFNGGYIQLPRVCTTETQFTFSAWVYARSGARYIICQWWGLRGAFLQIYDDRRIEFYINDVFVFIPITLNRWYYVVATFDGTTARLYLNADSPASAPARTPIWPSQNMYIGDRSDHMRKFYGFIDEVRVSNIARNSDWILTEYNNQLNPATFYSVGAEETYA